MFKNIIEAQEERNIFQEKYIVKVDRQNQKIKIKEKIEIILYETSANKILVNPKKIIIKKDKIIDEPLRESLKKLLEEKIEKIAKIKYIQIFINDVDHYGFLMVEDRNKFFEKIVHAIAVGTSIYKNY